ncbi:MAG: 4Fe-4S ferredoxin [Candidatus Heimdallarchaeota archaeon]
METLQLLETNVGDSRLREAHKILLVGTCVITQTEETLELFKDRPWVTVCLEALHVNHAGFKLVQMIQVSKIRDVAVLTKDGSPHCIQAHFLIEDIKKHFVPDLVVNHFVIEKDFLEQVSAQAIKLARHLSQVEKMIRNR